MQLVQPEIKSATDRFRELPEGTPAQVINDTLILMTKPSLQHQRVALALASMLKQWVSTTQWGEVLMECNLFLEAGQVYEPDVCVVRHTQAYQLHSDGIHGAPAFVIEVLSPSTASFDKHEKFLAYQQAGVLEYHLVDPIEGHCQSYTNQQGSFKLYSETKGQLVSHLLGTSFSW